MKKEEFLRDRVLVFLKKNKDYGDSVAKSLKKYGEVALLVRIEDKFNRLNNLIESNKFEVSDERVEDTVLDLFNYVVLHYAYLESKKQNIKLKDFVKVAENEINLYESNFLKSGLYWMLTEKLNGEKEEAERVISIIKKFF